MGPTSSSVGSQLKKSCWGYFLEKRPGVEGPTKTQTPPHYLSDGYELEGPSPRKALGKNYNGKESALQVSVPKGWPAFLG